MNIEFKTPNAPERLHPTPIKTITSGGRSERGGDRRGLGLRANVSVCWVAKKPPHQNRAKARFTPLGLRAFGVLGTEKPPHQNRAKARFAPLGLRAFGVLGTEKNHHTKTERRPGSPRWASGLSVCWVPKKTTTPKPSEGQVHPAGPQGFRCAGYRKTTTPKPSEGQVRPAGPQGSRCAGYRKTTTPKPSEGQVHPAGPQGFRCAGDRKKPPHQNRAKARFTPLGLRAFGVLGTEKNRHTKTERRPGSPRWASGLSVCWVPKKTATPKPSEGQVHPAGPQGQPFNVLGTKKNRHTKTERRPGSPRWASGPTFNVLGTKKNRHTKTERRPGSPHSKKLAPFPPGVEQAIS